MTDLLNKLADEDLRWQGWCLMMKPRTYGERMTEGSYTGQITSLPQVCGVWVFPEDVVGPITDITEIPHLDLAE